MRAFFSYELDKILCCRDHVLILFMTQVYGMYKLSSGEGEDTDLSLTDSFYIGYKGDAEVFFHQCGYGVFIGAFAHEFRGNAMGFVELVCEFSESGGLVISDNRIALQILKNNAFLML